jgi:hypothetical protein
MTPEVRTESVNIIEERLALLETELLLVQAASKDDTFSPEHVREWARRLLPVLHDLREWSHYLKETQ